MAKIAGIDVHKKLLVVVVIADETAPEQILEQGKFGSVRSELERLRRCLSDHGVTAVVMESTAQYWRPVGTSWKDASVCIWRMRSPTAPPKDASRILPTRGA